MTRSRRSGWLIGAMSVVLVVGACQSSSESGEPTGPQPSSASAPPTTAEPSENTTATFPVTITDAAGAEHTFDAPPKIGCLWTGCDEALADLGLVPEASSSSWAWNSDFYYPHGNPAAEVSDWSDAEQWATAGVDIIVIGGPDTSWTEPIAQAADILALNYPTDPGAPEGVETHKQNMRTLAQIMGTATEAEAAIADFDAFLVNLRDHAPADPGDPSIAILYATDDGTYSLNSPEGAFCKLIAAEGWGHCAAPEGAEGGQVNAEAFLAEDPDWIVYLAFEEMVAEARTDEVWGELSAVKSGQVYDSYGDYDCCGLRAMKYALQDFAAQVWGSDSGVPDPGPQLEYDPSTSPLAE